MTARIFLCLCFALAPLAAQKQLFPPWPKIWSSFDTRPKDCHLGFVDARGRKILAGVETFGDLRSVDARQAVTLLVNDRGFWSEPIPISQPGIVYFSSFAVDRDGKVWLAWSEFSGGVWRVMARGWDGKPGAPAELSGGSRVALQPAIAALPGGEIYVAWEAQSGARFAIQGASHTNGRWTAPETLASGGDHEFRPALAADSNGALWLAWDRATGARYETFIRHRENGAWSRERNLFPGANDARVPQMRADGSGRVWVLASGRLAGTDRSGALFEIPAAVKTLSGADYFTVDPQGRFWFFRGQGTRHIFDWQPASRRQPTILMTVVDADGAHQLDEAEGQLGYAAPQVDTEGNVWVMNSNQFLRYAAPYPKAAGAPAAAPARAITAAREAAARVWPARQFTVDGKPHRLYWAEMHNHLQELPTDKLMATWVDRLYLTARYRDGLNALALTDHDWPGMTRSMYYVEQGLASVLNATGTFLAISGYEWSGDSQVRGRFGDRTVLFPPGYHDIPRISDPGSDDNFKLNRKVKALGALDWPHHIGRAESPVDPRHLMPETEPVMEMTSGHGVFETYRKEDMVQVPFHTQIIPGTSVQDALASGKRVGMVGSSDSHSGFSGYRVGMLAIAAPELTQTAILDAIRKRRVYAIRGGEPIVLDFRVDGHFMGESFVSAKPPRLHVSVQGSRPVTRIELVRNNRFILAKDYTDGGTERALEYQDQTMPPAFYYVRITQGEGSWAWSSPIWVDPK